MGFRDDAFLLILCGLIGVVTAAAAVGFHELIQLDPRRPLSPLDPEFLYRTGIPLIILWPALGGLVTGDHRQCHRP